MVGVRHQDRLKRRHAAQIWGIFAGPSRRGLGIGRVLILATIETNPLPVRPAEIQLSVITTQPAAQALCQSLGFRSFGIEPEALCLGGKYLGEECMNMPAAIPNRFRASRGRIVVVIFGAREPNNAASADRVPSCGGKSRVTRAPHAQNSATK
jgi:hypothetical protein